MKCLFSPTRGLGCRSECENCPSPEFPGSVGSRRCCGTPCPRGCIGEGPCTSHCCTDRSTVGRVREVLRASGEASQKAQEAVAEALKGADSERGRVGGGEASVGRSPSRSCSPTSSATSHPRERRVDASRISVDVPVDRGGRQETPPSEWRNHTIKYKSRSGVVTVSQDAQCGLRAVWVGEASHPGPGSRPND